METPKNSFTTEVVEQQAAKIPSHVFLCTSLTIIGLCLGLKAKKKNGMALFLGQWVAPLLILGLYNKMVRTEGTE